MSGNTIYLGNADMAMRKFNFDHCFDSFDPKDPKFASQIDVYKSIGSQIIKNAFLGFNACVFAYGQTGSGKSYSIMGDKEAPGIVPRICNELFSEIQARTKDGVTFHVETSMIEIYNEKVRDLFNPGNPSNEKGLKVREHPKTGPYVENLASCVVSSGQQILDLLDEGNKYRTIAATQMNQTSSRAHTIFTINLSIRTKVKTLTSVSTARLNLIDLAGSERVAKTGASGQRFKEGTAINLSLICLGSVIEQLAKKSQQQKGGGGRNKRKKTKKKVFVRFRDSTLTWLLKDSLGGNSMTFMVATISPAAYNYNETLSTLRYADRAKKIRTKPKKNEDANARIIRELKAEIKRLKELLEKNNANQTSNAAESVPVEIHKKTEEEERREEEERIKKEAEMEKLKEQNEKLMHRLEQSETLFENFKTTEEEKMKKTLELEQSRRKELETKFGLVSQIEELRLSLPHIINLAEDPSLSGSLIYFMREAETTIGSVEAHIKLQGIQKLGVKVRSRIIRDTKTNQCRLVVDHEESIVQVNGKKVPYSPPIPSENSENSDSDSDGSEGGANSLEKNPERAGGIVLFQGDSIIFGNKFVFKYLNPHEVGKVRPPSNTGRTKPLKNKLFSTSDDEEESTHQKNEKEEIEGEGEGEGEETDEVSDSSSSDESESESEDKDKIKSLKLSPIKSKSKSKSKRKSKKSKKEDKDGDGDGLSNTITVGRDELYKALDFTKKELVTEYERIREQQLQEMAKEQLSPSSSNSPLSGMGRSPSSIGNKHKKSPSDVSVSALSQGQISQLIESFDLAEARNRRNSEKQEKLMKVIDTSLNQEEEDESTTSISEQSGNDSIVIGKVENKEKEDERDESLPPIEEEEEEKLKEDSLILQEEEQMLDGVNTLASSSQQEYIQGVPTEFSESPQLGMGYEEEEGIGTGTERNRRKTIVREAKKWFDQLKKEEAQTIQRNFSKASKTLEHIRDNYTDEIENISRYIKRITTIKKELDSTRYKILRHEKLVAKKNEYSYRIQTEGEKGLYPKLEEIEEKLKNANSKKNVDGLLGLRKKRKECQYEIFTVFLGDGDKKEEEEMTEISSASFLLDNMSEAEIEFHEKESEIEKLEEIVASYSAELDEFRTMRQVKDKNKSVKSKDKSKDPKSKSKTKKNVKKDVKKEQVEEEGENEKKSDEKTEESDIPKEKEKTEKEKKKVEFSEDELDEKIEFHSKKLKKMKEKLRNLENGSFLSTKNMLQSRKREAEKKLGQIEESIGSEDDQNEGFKKLDLDEVSETKKKPFKRPPLNISLSFTFNKHSLVNQLLGKKNSYELLELMEKINQANTISSELQQEVEFSLKVKYSLNNILYFVQMNNIIKQQVTDLPKLAFLERVADMNDYYNKALFNQHLTLGKKSYSSREKQKVNDYFLLSKGFVVPFDENPFHKSWIYSIGTNTVDVSSFLKKHNFQYCLNLLDNEMHVMARVHFVIDDLSKSQGGNVDSGDDSSSSLYEEEDDVDVLLRQSENPDSPSEENDEILEGEYICLRFQVVYVDGLPSKYIRDAHLRFSVGEESDWGESRHVAHNVKEISELLDMESDDEEIDTKKETKASALSSFLDRRKKHRKKSKGWEGGRVDFPKGELFYIEKEVYSEDDLFMEITLFGELFKFHTKEMMTSLKKSKIGLTESPQGIGGKVTMGSFSEKKSKEMVKDKHQRVLSQDLALYLNPRYKKLIVRCCKGKNLKNVRMFKFLKLNSYCKVKFRETKGKTKPFKGTAFPQWNQNLVFKLPSSSPERTEVIVVEVMNRETFGKNPLIGRCFIPLSKCEELFLSGEKEWFALRHPSAGSKFSGKIKLTFMFEY